LVDPEKKLNGFDKYQKAILDVVSERIKLSSDEDREGVLECYENLLFDKDGPTRLEKVLSKDEEFLSTVSVGFFEINSSYESLCDFEIYVRRFPYGGTSITKVRYLSHIIEAYLHEMYIFKKRLIKFLNELGKAYKSDRRRLEVEEIVESLCNYVAKCLRSIVSLRGSHVHSKRYTDRDLDKLRFLESVAPSDADLADLYESEYKKIRKR